MTEQEAVTQPITIDDLRQKAMRVADTVEAEARLVAEQRTSRLILAGAIVFGVSLSLAYFLGTRRGC